MEQWGPKHVELTYVMNETQSLKNFVYLVWLHIYYKMIHGPYSIKLISYVFQSFFCTEDGSRKFLRNGGIYRKQYMTSRLRKP